MPSMYAKLMSRITESSLMEERVEVRYCFLMMLAIADPQGYVIGTDVAIARRMNISPADFQSYVGDLMKPDPHSNSQEEDGRRVVTSDSERGYYVVNYRKYRDTRDEEQRREYMRKYMADRREKEGVKKVPVNSRKHRKPQLAQEEVEVEVEKDTPPASGGKEASEEALKFADWFRQDYASTVKLSQTWRAKWAKCYEDMLKLDGRTKSQVIAICKWAKADAFWASNFITPMKLRERNKDGVQYFDVFSQKRDSEKAANGSAPTPEKKEKPNPEGWKEWIATLDEHQKPRQNWHNTPDWLRAIFTEWKSNQPAK